MSVQGITETYEDGTQHEEYSDTQQGIHDVILRLFSDAKTQVERIAAQFSQNGGVLIQVNGTLLRKGCRESNFVQSFFLAVQERGFFVLNDILNISPKYPSSTNTPPVKNDSSNPVLVEGVPQPCTPRDGLVPSAANPSPPTIYPHSRKAPANTAQTAPDPEYINQVLIDTKKALNSTVQPQISSSESQQIHGNNRSNTNANNANTATNTTTNTTISTGKTSYAQILKLTTNKSNRAHPPSQTAGGEVGGSVAATTPNAVTHARHTKTHSYGDVQGSLTNLEEGAGSMPTGGFLLPSRRRNSMSGSHGFACNASVFVRDIPPNMEEKDLRDIFEQFGAVTSVVIRTGKRDSRFGFVDFAETSSMERALLSDSVSYQGRRLGIQEKKPIVIRNKPRYHNSRSMCNTASGSIDLNSTNTMTGTSNAASEMVGGDSYGQQNRPGIVQVNE